LFVIDIIIVIVIIFVMFVVIVLEPFVEKTITTNNTTTYFCLKFECDFARKLNLETQKKVFLSELFLQVQSI